MLITIKWQRHCLQLVDLDGQCFIFLSHVFHLEDGIPETSHPHRQKTQKSSRISTCSRPTPQAWGAIRGDLFLDIVLTTWVWDISQAMHHHHQHHSNHCFFFCYHPIFVLSVSLEEMVFVWQKNNIFIRCIRCVFWPQTWYFWIFPSHSRAPLLP